MVCHAVFCRNVGGEKAILDFVKIVLVFLSFSNGIFGVLGSMGITGNNFEEVFWSNRKHHCNDSMTKLTTRSD